MSHEKPARHRLAVALSALWWMACFSYPCAAEDFFSQELKAAEKPAAETPNPKPKLKRRAPREGVVSDQEDYEEESRTQNAEKNKLELERKIHEEQLRTQEAENNKLEIKRRINRMLKFETMPPALNPSVSSMWHPGRLWGAELPV